MFDLQRNPMKITNVFFLALFFIQPIISNPFSVFKPWTWFSMEMNNVQKILQLVHLEKMHDVMSEFENIEKMYKIASAPINIETFKKNKALILALRIDTERLNSSFMAAQERWKLSDSVYYASGIDRFKQQVLNPAVINAEKDAGVSHKDRPVSWYTKLKNEEKTYYCPGLYNGEKKAEFKEWQQEYEKKEQKAKDRNDFFEQWRQKNPHYNKPEFNKI